MTCRRPHGVWISPGEPLNLATGIGSVGALPGSRGACAAPLTREEVMACPSAVGCKYAGLLGTLDITGEVSFAGISTLTYPVFRLELKVDRACFGLRHQD